MVIEEADNKDIIIRIRASEQSEEIKRAIDYLRYLQLVSKSKAGQADADRLADEVNASWWNANKHRFLP
jgi:hypothetical protein